MSEDRRSVDLDDLDKALRASSWSSRAGALRELTARLAGGGVDHHAELRLASAVIDAASDEKWEVRKAAALALGEFRHLDGDVMKNAIASLIEDSNRWVSQAAVRGSRRSRERLDQANDWPLTGDSNDANLQLIVSRIRKIGLRTMTPAQIYDLALEVGKQFYRDLAADTAHEIRTMLTPLEGYLVELQRHLAEREQDDDANRYLNVALARLLHLQAMVEDLHTYSSPVDDEKFVPVDLACVVQDAVAMGVERASRESTASAFRPQVAAPEGLIVEAVKERLVRAVANLVANACQAMPNGGTLAVEAKVIGAEFAEVTVTDTGHGMTAEQVDHAMQRFRTTRRDDGGTGLGLPIAERIIQHDHGGELSIESTPGAGTKAVIVLPLRRQLDKE